MKILRKKIDFAHRSDDVARSGSRELRAVKIPASYDAWRPPKRRKNDSVKIRFFRSRKSVCRNLRIIVIYGPSYKTLGRSIDRIEMNIESIESKKRKMKLLKELSRTSWDSFESESDSKEWLNSFKNGIFHFCLFWAN